HRPSMVGMGMNFRAPLGHLREYLQILKALLQTGKVDFDGTYYRAHETIPEPLDVPVMASALQPKSFELCGAESDGAISWVRPVGQRIPGSGKDRGPVPDGSDGDSRVPHRCWKGPCGFRASHTAAGGSGIPVRADMTPQAGSGK